MSLAFCAGAGIVFPKSQTNSEMGRDKISVGLRRLIENDGKDRCGYCLTQRHLIGQPMTIEHIVPRSKGGSTIRENLWTSCIRCNLYKANRTSATDPLTHKRVPLFNPREQIWQNHFVWNRDKTHIVGITAQGRATVDALRLNNADIVGARLLWVQAGWHPPTDY